MASNTVTVTIDARPAIDAIAEVQELIRSHASLRAEVEALRADAERYRWLRARHWHDAPMCVVVDPHKAVKFGHDCPTGERLDFAIDAARAAQGVKP